MTQEQRLILEAGDVFAIRLECVKCQSAIVIRPSDWRDAPFQCPSCSEMWELPRIPGQGPNPLQHIGLGLRGLADQVKASGPVKLPYKVKFEVKQD
jgi:hypothetical protein